MPRATSILRWLAFALLVAALTVPASGVQAHGDEDHAAGASATPISSGTDGAGGRDFATPPPGSYALPAMGDAADGRVLDERGGVQPLHASFGDRIVLLSFIYTRCADGEGCPLATAVLHRVGARLGEESDLRDRVRLVSLSFDPEHDTPEVMAAYGRGFASKGLDWRFLTTASEAELAPLLSAYRQTRVPEVDASGEETGAYAHLLRVFLIDRQLRIRQVYSTSLLDADALVADVKTLVLEASSDSAGGPPSGPVAAGVRPGDDRTGYGKADFATRSAALAARQGQAVDLVERIERAPLGLPPLPIPEDDPITPEKVSLGRRLFFDRRLSHNDTISCAMCHVPEQGFANNEMATAVGIEGRSVRRNAPTLYNVAYAQRLFHDGRDHRLEHQVWGPLLARNEMGNPSVGAVVARLRDLPGYEGLFEAAFPGRGLAIETIGMALASYQRTLVSGDSAFDRAFYGDEPDALSPSARRGLEVFRGKAGCVGCHRIGADAALLTDHGFHNTGIGFAVSSAPRGGGSSDTLRVQVAPGVVLEVPREIVESVAERPANDLGRYEVTRDPADRWKYRTPTLRNVALTAPYMHDGSLATLTDVVAFYDRGGVDNELLDPAIRPLGMSAGERSDLVAFLESLTGSDVDVLVMDAFAAPIGDVATPAPSRGD